MFVCGCTNVDCKVVGWGYRDAFLGVGVIQGTQIRSQCLMCTLRMCLCVIRHTDWVMCSSLVLMGQASACMCLVISLSGHRSECALGGQCPMAVQT